MIVAEGILTSRGGLVSHAAVVARGWGKPAVVGAESIQIDGKSFTAGGQTVNEGDPISVDGTTGKVMLGKVGVTTSEPPPEFMTILSWADAIREGKMAVRANADTGPDAANARQFGAEGIGLCRTEHMFLGDRLPVIRRMIMANTDEEETAALEELRLAQKADFYEVLEAMDGLPVTVRLLDPPLHEFLPRAEELLVKQAKAEPLSEQEQKELQGGPVLARVQPHARHERRPPRRAQARPLRHAGQGPDGGGRRAGRRRWTARRRDHDPADGQP